MSKELTVIDGLQIPSYLQGLAPANEDFGSAGALPKISIVLDKSGFRITEGGKALLVPPLIQVTILGASPRGKALSRAFFLAGYTQDSTAAPDCASSGGVFPDSGEKRQATECAVCPHSMWGSGRGGGQACKQTKLLYVVNAGDGASSTVYQLRVPPTSLKALGSYGNTLTAHGLDKATVITAIGYEATAVTGKDYPILSFRTVGFLSQDAALASVERSRSPEIEGLIYDSPVTLSALPAPAAAPVAQLPQPVPPVCAIPLPQGPKPQSATTVTIGTGWGAVPQSAPVQHTAAPVPQPTPVQYTAAPVPQPTPAPQTTGVELDSTGQPWNPLYHSSGRSKIKDGTWKKKRGAGEDGPPPAPVGMVQAPVDNALRSKPVPTGSALSGIVNKWSSI